MLNIVLRGCFKLTCEQDLQNNLELSISAAHDQIAWKAASKCLYQAFQSESKPVCVGIGVGVRYVYQLGITEQVEGIKYYGIHCNTVFLQ